MLDRFKKYYFTVKDLKWIQIFYQLRYKIYKHPYKALQFNGKVAHFSTDLSPVLSTTFSEPKTFTFLNIRKVFSTKIEWSFQEHGLLWNYNLNYFDFLHQKNISKDNGYLLIRQFISDGNGNYDPYPTSLRIINWTRFLSKYQINDKQINDALYAQAMHLIKHLEYHLLGNHLLENGFALIHAAYYFRDVQFYSRSVKILKKQLKEQILSDGAHFELSPMYHQIVLFRVLQTSEIMTNNLVEFSNPEFENSLRIIASDMLSWITNMQLSNGDLPRFNDSTGGIAPDVRKLLDYATKLKVVSSNLALSASGYRKISGDHYEAILDIGELGPHYIPGHAHSDIGNFELYHKKVPLIVDTGISTYEKNEIRNRERSTASHNTLQIGQYEQSQVWSGFRVGRKAEILSKEEQKGQISVSHNGYASLGIVHRRTFNWAEKTMVITDNVSKLEEAKVYLHFHPDVKVTKEGMSASADGCTLKFKNATNIIIQEYDYAIGFNQRTKAKKMIITFQKYLSTKLYFE